MVLERRIFKEFGFLAIATLEPGKRIEADVDPIEEIYFVLQGTAEMGVDNEKQQVGSGDATWIPTGSSHGLLNSGNENLVILVVAKPNW